MSTKDPICQECNGRARFEAIGRIIRADKSQRTYEIYRCDVCDTQTDRNGDPIDPSNQRDPLDYARGDYQRDLLEGRARWSGSDLTGRASSYRGRYQRSRDALRDRLEAAGFEMSIKWERGERGRYLYVWYVDGRPVSARS